MSKRYCPMCDEWMHSKTVCPKCGVPTMKAAKEAV